MDLTIPYTFYPSALPAWISWTLFLLATVGATTIGVARGWKRGWIAGLGTGTASLVALLAATMLASMVITFFVHDI